MLGAEQRKVIFDAARSLGAKFKSRADVATLDSAIDAAFQQAFGGIDAVTPIVITAPAVTPQHRKISKAGLDLIHSYEQCKLTAYPDPGSADGNPWTIGWGSTGPDIKKGLVWTREQADERFKKDIAKFEKIVDEATKDVPTNQNQFDAMVSLCYNIGPGRPAKGNQKAISGFLTSTVLRKHRAGDYPAAARAFLMWNKNDGKVMRGLTRRRMAEADLYDN